MKKNNIAVIIPSLDPDDKLTTLVEQLLDEGYQNVILVNDGSHASYDAYFNRYHDNQNVHVLNHAINLGKGRALKNAFNYILTQLPDCMGAVTIDSDGQHRLVDMEACIDCLSQHPKALVLGCRTFEDKEIPLRSRFGNIVTSKMMKVLCGIAITDTQTGLRAFSRELMIAFLGLKGERFEYEMNMLLYTKEHNVTIQQVPIETIYIEENETSHFNPLLDSARIYAVFFKFILSSIWSFVIDIAMFTVMVAVLKSFEIGAYIIIATIIARVISSVFNFTLNKTQVFRNVGNTTHVAFRYFTLCIVQLTCSALGVTMLYHATGINESLIKVLVDMVLFVLSFQIQRDWVFKQ